MLSREPVAVAALIRILLVLAVSFGLDLSEEQIGLMVTAAAIVEAWIVRGAVYAPANVDPYTESEED